MSIRDDSVLFLLGAGASVDAGIMHAKGMTADIESKIKAQEDFIGFESLYNHLKSCILYQRGLEGDFTNQEVTVEDLLNVLSEINQKHQNKLYPFIGSWNVHLIKVSGEDFIKVDQLERLIRDQLYDWINIQNYDASDYFKGFGELANEVGQALRIFTLNYDLCVERALASNGISMELGFDEVRQWEASRFDENQNEETQVFLYKLHGSIDWIREDHEGHILTKCDNPQRTSELIFGVTAKLNSIDPYLFYVHEFRKYSLQQAMRLIVSVGYSFSDEYINKLISQAIKRNEYAKVLSVSPSASKPEEVERIARLLGVPNDKVIGEGCTAKIFFEEILTLKYLEEKSNAIDDTPF